MNTWYVLLALATTFGGAVGYLLRVGIEFIKEKELQKLKAILDHVNLKQSKLHEKRIDAIAAIYEGLYKHGETFRKAVRNIVLPFSKPTVAPARATVDLARQDWAMLVYKKKIYFTQDQHKVLQDMLAKTERFEEAYFSALETGAPPGNTPPWSKYHEFLRDEYNPAFKMMEKELREILGVGP